MFKYIRVLFVIAIATSAISTTLAPSLYARDGDRKGYFHQDD